jgi:hypothetical protein
MRFGAYSLYGMPRPFEKKANAALETSIDTSALAKR